MTIDGAIGVNEQMLAEAVRRQLPGRVSALELGIEALKRCKEARKKVYFTTRSLLPGETEE